MVGLLALSLQPVLLRLCFLFGFFFFCVMPFPASFEYGIPEVEAIKLPYLSRFLFFTIASG